MNNHVRKCSHSRLVIIWFVTSNHYWNQTIYTSVEYSLYVRCPTVLCFWAGTPNNLCYLLVFRVQSRVRIPQLTPEKPM